MMEKFLNIFKIPDLRKKLVFTGLLLLVYRLGGKVPNRRQVKVRAVRKNHKAELSWHPVRIKSQELDRMALNKQLKRARKAHKLQVTLWWQRVREKKQVQNLAGQRPRKNNKVQAETREIGRAHV